MSTELNNVAMAYGEITIVDLLDTATYIYYSANDDYSNPTTKPQPDSKYIGIYCGIPSDISPARLPLVLPAELGGQPAIPPEGTVWSQYVGEKGEPGQSITIDETIVEYAVSDDGQQAPESGWQNSVPKDIEQGQWLWTRTIVKYSDKTETVTYTKSYQSKDGISATGYSLELGYNEILRFKEKPSDGSSDIKLSWTPTETKIRVKFLDKYLTTEEYNKLTWNVNLINVRQGTIISSLQNPEWRFGEDAKIPDENGFYNLLVQSSYFTKDINTDENIRYIEDFLSLLTKDLPSLIESNDTIALDDNIDIPTAKKWLREDDCYFEIIVNIYENENHLNSQLVDTVKTVIPVKFGTSADMATFNLHATGFNAAIQNSKLEFSANGLTVKNGGIQIINNNNEKVLEADVSGNLTMHGTVYATNGKFTGEINATSGTFTGTVNATDGNFTKGNIAGFIFDNEKISSQDGTLVLHSDGIIDVNNINIGQDARIVSKLSLGDLENVYLASRPADLADDVPYTILKAYDTTLSSDGLLTLSAAQSSNGSWSIDNQGVAVFDKIHTKNITLENSVMAIDTVQSVGSTMIFKSAYLIQNVAEETTNLIVNDIAGDYYQIELYDLQDNISLTKDEQTTYVWLSYGNEQKLTLLIEESTKNEEGKIINRKHYISSQFADILKPEQTIVTIAGQNKDYLFAITSDDNTLTSRQWGEPASLTLSQLQLNEDNLKFNRKLVLGNITQPLIDQHFIPDGYTEQVFGLYADYVVLNGSLTTSVPIRTDDEVKPTYAGINTLSLAKKANDKGEDENIVFWAGAAGVNESDIADAPFIVTDTGNLYANKGRFQGSILTDAEIYASAIYAAEFHGVSNPDDLADKEGAPALRLYEVGDKGSLIIMRNNNGKYDDYIRFTSAGISQVSAPDSFIDWSKNNAVNFKGDTLTINQIQPSVTSQTAIKLDSDSKAQIKLTAGAEFVTDNDGFTFKGGATRLFNTLALSNSDASGTIKTEIRPVDAGCDIYVL